MEQFEYTEVRSKRKSGEKKNVKRLCAVGGILLGVCLLVVGLKLRAGSHSLKEAKQPRNHPYPAEEESPIHRKNLATTWNLLLVNENNPVPEAFSVELEQLIHEHAIDKRVYPELQAMMDAMREEGLSPLICSSYRTDEQQRALYDNKLQEFLSEGYYQEEAEAETGKWVAVPGTSEHQTGLAVDIVDEGYQHLDEAQEATAVQNWLIHHSWEYGFILRYPSDKGSVTGIAYEPWHYRYVGKEAAKEIHEKGLCLEEYLELFSLNIDSF